LFLIYGKGKLCTIQFSKQFYDLSYSVSDHILVILFCSFQFCYLNNSDIIRSKTVTGTSKYIHIFGI